MDAEKGSCFRRFSNRFVLDSKSIAPQIKKIVFGIQPYSCYQTPIVINNFNRLEMLLKLILSLTQRGYTNIYIIDNNSTYPPLLEYYKSCPYTVFRLNRNVGHLAVWETGIYKMFTDGYFAYTDSDLELHSDCPNNFMDKFVDLLQKYPRVLKVGFSICIDDLPNTFSNKEKVIQWESNFWKKKVERDVYKAPIDTTFAVYKPYFCGEIIDFKYRYFRVGFPYSVHHLPWYIDSLNLDEEEQYYIDQISTSTHWSEQTKKE